MQPKAPLSRLRTIVRIGAPLLLIGLLSGCLIPPDPKTEAAKDVFNLYLLVLALAAIVFVGVEGFLLYAAGRGQRQGRCADHDPGRRLPVAVDLPLRGRAVDHRHRHRSARARRAGG